MIPLLITQEGHLRGFLGKIYLGWCCLGGGTRAVWKADGLKLVQGRDGVLMAGGDQDFGGQEEGKGCLHGMEHHPVPSTLQRTRSCSEQNPPGQGGSGIPEEPQAGLAGLGNFKEEQIPSAIKKGHFLQRRPAWRGERAQCCNHGEVRALTQPSAAGSSSGWPRSSRSTRPLLLWHQQQQQGTRRGHGLGQARLEVSLGRGMGDASRAAVAMEGARGPEDLICHALGTLWTPERGDVAVAGGSPVLAGL